MQALLHLYIVDKAHVLKDLLKLLVLTSSRIANLKKSSSNICRMLTSS